MRAPAIATATAFVVALGVAAPASLAQTTGSGTVLKGTKVNVRATPGGKKLGRISGGRTLKISCQTNGSAANGPGGRSAVWDQIRFKGKVAYINDTFVSASPSRSLVAPMCGAPQPTSSDSGATSGACRITSPAPVIAPYTDHDAFVADTVPGAQRSQRETGVPASVTIAQAIQESAWGAASAGANNFFGMKAQTLASPAGTYAWSGVAIGCVLRKTQEVVKGKSETQIAAFRAYRSLSDSIRDHGLRLLANPVYAPAFKYTSDPERFARGIGKFYATDPHYASSVISLMRRLKLEKYDVASDAAKPTGGEGTTGSTGASGTTTGASGDDSGGASAG